MHVDMCSRFLTNLSEEMQSAVRRFVVATQTTNLGKLCSHVTITTANDTIAPVVVY